MSWSRSSDRKRSSGLRLRKAPSSPTRSSTKSTVSPCDVSMSDRGIGLKICAAILASVFATFADCPSASATTPSEPQITAVSEGEPAPFDGDLYPIDVSIRYALEIEGCSERAAADAEHASRLHKVELQRLRGLAAADSRADKQRIALLQSQLDTERAWYRSPTFVAAVSATVAVATLLVSTVLVQATGEARQ